MSTAYKFETSQVVEPISQAPVTREQLRAYAEASGDPNPIHLDEEFAKNTRFGQRIAHGMLSGAFISAVLGYEFSERKIK